MSSAAKRANQTLRAVARKLNTGSVALWMPVTHVPVPVNETVLGYAPGSKERAGIESALDRMAGEDPHRADRNH